VSDGAAPDRNGAAPLVLLVEDSELVTDALTVLLEATGHRVRVAASVRGAVAAARAERPDVMLLDLTLPDGDGLDVLAALGDGSAPRTIAALTGHDDDATRARCLAAGCHDVLSKPVPTGVLLARMRAWTAR
jgi:DNA-binding response OmpR family regulator